MQSSKLVIGMFKELTEQGNNIKEDIKVIISKIKKNLQGTKSEEKETGIQINYLEHKQEKNQPEQEEKKEFDKTRIG